MTKAKTPAVGLDSLRARTNAQVVARNRALKQLASLRASKRSYQFENEFLKEAGIAQTHVKLIRAEFAKHQTMVLEVGKNTARVVWFPNPADATAIRKEQAALKKALSAQVNEG